MCTCNECGKSFIPNNYKTDVCLFCRCFKRPSKQEIEMANQQFQARLKFQEILVKEGYSYEECAEMSLIELRDAVDEVQPLVVTNSSVTLRGGKTRKVTIVKKAA